MSPEEEQRGKHPAVYTKSIIDKLEELIPRYVPAGQPIHDPFAGNGQRLGALCAKLGHPFSGTDLEVWKDPHQAVWLGDSTQSSTYPSNGFAIVTSPSYNNGCNDSFTPKDKSDRKTYTIAAGHELHPNNTGRWSGRSSKRGEREYWRITDECVQWWPDIAIVNVKDSIRKGAVYPFTLLWRNLLEHYGYEMEQFHVECPGWRKGTNGQARVEYESILVARR